ncbi:sigma-70 family RNA polymerase sigma factor [Rhodopirellula sp. SWK7]|uniref:sigma-70 family RNA polymerase sigma factor n=1 Tax=Rhodopirellula sp. SWK7 TaxID=595460 RepID=UPI0002BE0D9B|nr:sigma-70 family RNA polymerase sigma factor [Rhodopirellula sp. SWK7]EMI42907.1 RNA polymerase sigma-70 ECF-like, Rhodopirellula baltica [Rhodopirellula sp. SWK7]
MDKPSNDAADEELVALIAARQTTLRAIIRSMLPGCADCEDILQETNMILWRKRESFQPGTNFNAWAGTIARLQVLAWLKKNQRRKSVGFDGDLLERIASAASECFDNLNERRDALNVCLHELSDGNRELIEHRYVHKTPLADYARKCGKTEAAVAKILERLRSRLRDCIGRRLSTEPQS